VKLIDIRTTQNVTISYELAGLRDRILASLLDWLILGFGMLIVSLILALMLSSFDEVLEIVLLLVNVLIFFFYTLIMEVMNNGQSVGKMALRIKVMKLDGQQLTFFDYLLRWAFRIVDIWFTVGAIGSVLLTSTDHGQRLGGLVSNSTVVKLSPQLSVSLADILKIKTKDNYKPKYPAIRSFRESDMLLIKQTLDRHRQYKNEAHGHAVSELASIVAAKLNIEGDIPDKVQFLKTLIKDYIVLTR
jgi:uncharacterized RDD family membrane protein YckC